MSFIQSHPLSTFEGNTENISSTILIPKKCVPCVSKNRPTGCTLFACKVYHLPFQNKNAHAEETYYKHCYKVDWQHIKA